MTSLYLLLSYVLDFCLNFSLSVAPKNGNVNHFAQVYNWYFLYKYRKNISGSCTANFHAPEIFFYFTLCFLFKIPINVTTAVSASATGNASHTPVIPSHIESRIAHPTIATNPLKIEDTNAHFAASTALKYPVPITLKLWTGKRIVLDELWEK